MRRARALVLAQILGICATLDVTAQAEPPAAQKPAPPVTPTKAPPPAAPASDLAATPPPSGPAAEPVVPAPPPDASAAPVTPPATSAAPAAPPAASAPAAPAPAPPPSSPNGVPPAASGFQIAFRTGVVFPFGDASDAPTDALSRRYAWQIPLVLDIGGRFAEAYFLGVYLGFGLGGTGSDPRVDGACTDDDEDGQNDIVCSAASLRAGIEMQYSFQPGESMNPWIGYGIGFEASTASLKDNVSGNEESVMSSGITYAQLSGGLDFRKKVGFGPFLEIALGQFNRTVTDLGSRGKFRYTIEDRALHAWVMLGLRLVVNP